MAINKAELVHSVGHKKAQKMGRGRLRIQVKFRVNRAQKAWIEDCAHRAGVDRSCYIRRMLAGRRPRSTESARQTARKNELLAFIGQQLLELRDSAAKSCGDPAWLVTLDAMLADNFDRLDGLGARPDERADPNNSEEDDEK